MACGVRQAISRTAIILVLALSIYGILLVFISSSSNPVLVLNKVKSISNGIGSNLHIFPQNPTKTVSLQDANRNLTDATYNATVLSKHDKVAIPPISHSLSDAIPPLNESKTLENGSLAKTLENGSLAKTLENGSLAKTLENGSLAKTNAVYSKLPVSVSYSKEQNSPTEPSFVDSTPSSSQGPRVSQGTVTQQLNGTTVGQTPSPHPVLVTSASIRSGFTLLTMFTTFKSLPSKIHIYKNTIRNWQQLIPLVQPVLYYIPGEPGLVSFAKDHGWATHPVPRSSVNKIPILRSMFLDAEERYKTPFYCYANGDILFNMSLIDTLKAIQPYQAKFQQVLIVGRRSNFKLSNQQSITSLDEVTKLANGSKLFGTNAQDYFLTTFNGYPWNSIPDFVVGRVGYDNWLVVTAIAKGIKVIDTTATLLALHQTGHDGDFAGHSGKEKRGDVSYNYKLAGMSFNYNMGHVTCSQFMTRFNKSNVIELVPKKKKVPTATLR